MSDAVSHPWPLAVACLGKEGAPESAATPEGALDHAADNDLAALAAAGRRDAFDAIVTRHRRAVYRVCYRFANNHEDASDLAQEVFLRAWRGLPAFKGQSALSTWLFRIAVNVSLNKVSGRSPGFEPIETAEELADPKAERPGASMARAERAQAVRRAIRSLPPKQRATLVLRVYHDLSHRQIADVLGSSEGTVKANFFHALAGLRRRLGGEP